MGAPVNNFLSLLKNKSACEVMKGSRLTGKFIGGGCGFLGSSCVGLDNRGDLIHACVCPFDH